MHVLAMTLVALGVLFVVVGNLWLLVVTFKVSVLWGLGSLFLPLVSLVFVIKHWSVARKPIAVAIASIPFLVVAVFVDPQHLRASTTAPQVSAADPTAPQPSPTEDPSAAGQVDEQLRSFASNGCRLSAPATWTVQAEAGNAHARLVIADPTGTLSVGIHDEPSAGTTLTKRDVARLMEKANRMPLKLEDSNWSSVDNHEAWREVRVGSLGGSERTWIRYSYRMGASVVQLIGVARGRRARDERKLLETIILSSHCEH
jgi:hypothetical protein